MSSRHEQKKPIDYGKFGPSLNEEIAHKSQLSHTITLDREIEL
jgi:hypothetical protein